MMKPKYPNVVVELSSIDGNAFTLLGATKKELRRAGVSKKKIEEFLAEATSDDYDHLVQTIMKWVETE